MKHRPILVILIFTLNAIILAGCNKTSKPTSSSLVESMDEYHRILRPLMHQALPEQNVAVFKENSAELLKRAETVARAEIPTKFLENKAEIENVATRLLEKTRLFQKTCQSGTDDEILKTFMAAHDAYEALANIIYRL